jgi:hypothetical protein
MPGWARQKAAFATFLTGARHFCRANLGIYCIGKPAIGH